MAEYRQLKKEFWQSPFVLSLNPEERAFYVFMLLNPSTTQSGIYALSIKMIVMMHGYNEEIIQEQIQKFITWKKLAYDPQTHEFLLVNWMKHHRPCNKKIFSKVGKEVRATKSKTLKDLWSTKNPLDAEIVGLPYTLLTVPQPLGNCMDKVLQPLSRGMDKVCEPLKHDNYNNTKESKEPKEQQPTDQQETGVNVLGSSLGLNDLKETFLSLGVKEQDQTEKIDVTKYQEEKKVTNQDGRSRTNPGKPSEPEENLLLSSFLTGTSEKPEKSKTCPPEEIIITYLNQQMCTNYPWDYPPSNRLIHHRLEQGFTVADFLVVIDKKIAHWRGTDYASNLCPMGLFGKNFTTYHQEKGTSLSTYRRLPPSEFHGKMLKQVFK
jgi:uncharacterized phage protein (TIGR02220 family)